MDSRQLIAFQTVARTNSITRAAAQLRYSQSAVTSQIKSLESLVHATLFERKPNGVELTAGGERFLPYANRLLKITEEALAAVAGLGEPSRITIGAGESITTYRLPELVEFLQYTHPDVRLSVRTFHEGPDSILGSLGRAEIDVALLNAMCPSDAVYASSMLSREDVVVIAAPDHPLSGRGDLCGADLSRATTLISQPGCVYAMALFADIGTTSTAPLQFGTVEAVKKAVCAGLGVAALPRVAVEDLLNLGAVTILSWTITAAVSTYAMWDELEGERSVLRSLLTDLEKVAQGWHTPTPPVLTAAP